MIEEMTDTAEHQAQMLRLKQAHAMLNLFETDCKRAAITIEEIKEWAYAQEDEQLRSRVNQLLSNGRD
jgi:hypothetical protein